MSSSLSAVYIMFMLYVKDVSILFLFNLLSFVLFTALFLLPCGHFFLLTNNAGHSDIQRYYYKNK